MEVAALDPEQLKFILDLLKPILTKEDSQTLTTALNQLAGGNSEYHGINSPSLGAHTLTPVDFSQGPWRTGAIVVGVVTILLLIFIFLRYIWSERRHGHSGNLTQPRPYTANKVTSHIHRAVKPLPFKRIRHHVPADDALFVASSTAVMGCSNEPTLPVAAMSYNDTTHTNQRVLPQRAQRILRALDSAMVIHAVADLIGAIVLTVAPEILSTWMQFEGPCRATTAFWAAAFYTITWLSWSSRGWCLRGRIDFLIAKAFFWSGPAMILLTRSIIESALTGRQVGWGYWVIWGIFLAGFLLWSGFWWILRPYHHLIYSSTASPHKASTSILSTATTRTPSYSLI